MHFLYLLRSFGFSRYYGTVMPFLILGFSLYYNMRFKKTLLQYQKAGEKPSARLLVSLHGIICPVLVAYNIFIASLQVFSAGNLHIALHDLFLYHYRQGIKIFLCGLIQLFYV